MPHSVSQSASNSRSAVQVPKLRTCAGSWSLGRPDTLLAGTATQCSRECTSMPAACGCVICKSSATTFLGFLRRADEFVVRTLRLAFGHADLLKKEATGAGMRRRQQSPKRGYERRAANDVIATSRDHA